MLSSIEHITIGNLFEKNARTFPDKTVQVFEDGTRQTYQELNERANRLANGLLDLGLKKGDHVAILATNCMEYMEYTLATAKVGIVSVLLNFHMPKERISYTLNHSDSKAVLFESPFIETIEFSRREAESLQHFIAIQRETFVSDQGIIDYETLITQSSNVKPNIEVKVTDANTLMYTSGTTGMPKGVLKSMAADMHHTVTSMMYYPMYDATHKLGLPAYSDLVSLVMPPLFHLGGYTLMMMPLVFPMTIVLTSGFEAEKMLRLIDEEKVNCSWIQPAMLYKVKQLPEETVKKYDVSSMIAIICGSTSLKEKERKELTGFFPNAKLGSNYSATESAFVSYVSEEELKMTAPNNLGRAIYNADLKIGDENGRELDVGEVGLIWATSPGLPINCEYYKDEENTKKSFKDGWVAVGDIGWKGEDGYFYYAGRSDDMINSGGEKVSLLQVEEVVQQYPGVNSAAVIGVEDEKWQEAVTAIIVPKNNEVISEKDIIQYCKEILAPYEVPKRVYMLDELPIGATGKVNKKQLKEMIQEKVIS